MITALKVIVVIAVWHHGATLNFGSPLTLLRPRCGAYSHCRP